MKQNKPQQPNKNQSTQTKSTQKQSTRKLATSSQSRPYELLDGTVLKLIAMVSMLVDHVGAVFFPEAVWMRAIGRLAMPIFSFCIAEGYIHTKDRKKYLLRMGIFALVSEVPFDLAFDGVIGLGHQNIMVTFFLAILALMLFDMIRGEKPGIAQNLLAGMTVLMMAVAALLLNADYTLFGVLTVFLFYVFRSKHPLLRAGAGVGFLVALRSVGYNLAAGLSFIPIAMYNGKKGKGLKWLFYAFYPGHLLALYALSLLLK
jgi:hypothetical protein